MSNTTRSSTLVTAAHPEKLRRVAIDPISQSLKGQNAGKPQGQTTVSLFHLHQRTGKPWSVPFCFDHPLS